MRAKEHIRVVPEVSTHYLELSGWQNLMFAGELYGLDKRARAARAEKLAPRIRALGAPAEPTRRYSKGMKQRLMLAMALIHRPKLLFLDEPTAGLDVASRRLIHRMVQQLAKDEATVFYTTHNIQEANVLCDRVAIISGGQLAAMDTPEALKATFASKPGRAGGLRPAGCA